jgi:hypothetical protein
MNHAKTSFSTEICAGAIISGTLMLPTGILLVSELKMTKRKAK